MEKYDIERQKANYYYVKAVQDLEETDARYYDRLRSAQRERLETIITGAIAKRDYIGAVKAIAEMNKMLGINEPDKKEIEFKDTTIRFNFENDINNDDDDNETVNE